MKSLLTSLLFFTCINLQCQIISNSDYSKMLSNAEECPNNVVKRLDSEGFDLLYNSNELTDINLTYILKKNDPYFYNIIIQRRGSIRNIVLTFNRNSAEYSRLSDEIVKKMIKQPKSKLGDYRITYYKDANNVYFGVNTIEKNDSEQTYQISILNFSAYKEYYLKIVKNK